MAALIAIDWGTTSFRACLLARDGRILDRVESADGILAVSGGGFAACLERNIARWTEGALGLPVVMSGMIGSRQGWREAPYLRCPASLRELSGALLRMDVTERRPVWIVPGLDIVDGDGRPDVMRGEETQVFGAMASSVASPQRFVLPGTHSKWVTADASHILSFKTYMTGEAYAALRGHTILGKLMSAQAGTGEGFAAGVRAGIAAGSAGALLNRMFAARTLGLTGRLAESELADYLSGLLIGAELADATQPGQSFTIVAGEALADRYVRASEIAGRSARRAQADCAAAGVWKISLAAGILEAGT